MSPAWGRARLALEAAGATSRALIVLAARNPLSQHTEFAARGPHARFMRVATRAAATATTLSRCPSVSGNVFEPIRPSFWGGGHTTSGIVVRRADLPPIGRVHHKGSSRTWFRSPPQLPKTREVAIHAASRKTIPVVSAPRGSGCTRVTANRGNRFVGPELTGNAGHAVWSGVLNHRRRVGIDSGLRGTTKGGKRWRRAHAPMRGCVGAPCILRLAHLHLYANTA
jgi:hypothetical protein